MMQEAWGDGVWRGLGRAMQGLIANWTSEETDMRIQVGHGGWSDQDPYLILWTLGLEERDPYPPILFSRLFLHPRSSIGEGPRQWISDHSMSL